MKISYRRYSGKPMLLGDKVTSTRGSWVEKRTAFISKLRDKNEVEFDAYDAEMLFVEFGSTNTQFYGEDIKKTIELVNHYKENNKKVIFLCDDPELVPKDVSEWATEMWVNANENACSILWKLPCKSFYFHALIQKLPYSTNHNNKIIYWGGSSGGREDTLAKLQRIYDIEVFGKQKEYTKIKVKEGPNQDKRMEFYSNFKFCLSLRDNKHIKLGWKTGRHYHAINAGIPALTVTELITYKNNELDNKLRLDIYKRNLQEVKQHELWNQQILENYTLA